VTIVDNYFPFDTGPGSTATAARWRLMGRLWYGSGVVPSYLNACAPSIAGSVVTIQTGAVWIDGYYGEIDSPKTVAVTGNGMVVLRMDPVARQILVVFVPNQTVPTQLLTGIYEVPVMQVTGATGKDIRIFSAPVPSGPVHAKVTRAGNFWTPSTYAVLPFDTVVYGSGFTGGVYTCPINADYLVSAQVGIETTAAGQWLNIWLQRTPVGASVINFNWNGSPSAQGASQVLVAHLTDVVPCSVGDKLQLTWLASTANLGGANGQGAIQTFMTVRALQ
jgi:hypothetical protein